VAGTASPPRRLGLVVILGSLVALAPLSIDLYLPALPEISRDLHAPASTVQLTLTACVLGLGLGQLVAGPLADALGRRRPLLVGLAAFVVGSALCAAAPSIAVLCVLRLIQGAAGAAGIVIAFAIVRDLYGRGTARMFALLMLITGVAPVVAPVVGAQALRVTTWRGTFVILVVLGAALLLFTAIGLRETLPPERRRPGGFGATLRTLHGLTTDRTYIPFAVAYALAFGAMFAYIAGSPFVLEDIHGLSPQLFSVVFAVNSAGLVAAAQVSGHIVDRAGAPRLLRIGLAAQAAAGVALMAVVASDAGLAPLLVCLFFVITANGFVLPNAMGLALTHQGDAAGSASALIGLLQFGLGGVLSPLVGIAGSDSAVPMAVCVVACAVGAPAVLLLARAGRRRSPAGP
jgi:DHA1 family bicyclomycin/chloramphenicol resistance-like MFS transporter